MTDDTAPGPPLEGRLSDGGGPPPRRRRLLPSGFATLRDVICFAFGVVIVAREVFVVRVAEPTVIMVGVGLMGLPLVLGADERRRGGDR